MSISYSGITNYGKATLPSVESWGTNNNILRDPPRSVTTRRIDKVFDTAMIDQEIQESGNRVAESIRVYPRGQNVMVGVSFNNSNSVGNRGNSINGQQAKLPYRVMKDGAFRPPILRPVNLLPLSRLPRNNVTVDPIAYTADYKRKIICPGTAKDYRSVKVETFQFQTNTSKTQKISKPVEVAVGQNILQNKLHTQTETKKIQNIRKPVEVSVGQSIVQNKIHANAEGKKIQNIRKPVEVSVGQSIVQNKIHANAEGKRVQNISRPVEIAVGQNIQDILKAEAQTNTRKYDYTFQSVKHTDDAVKQNIIHYQTQANPTRNVQIRNVDPTIVYQTNARVQASSQTNVKGIGKQHLLHETQEIREKPTLRGQISVNSSQKGRYNPEVQPTSTIYNLPQKPKMGGMEGTALIPSMDRHWGNHTLRRNGFADLMKQK
jgi:hypothetical protein